MRHVSRSRNLVGTWLRKGQVVRTLSYQQVDTAVPRLTFHAMSQGEPGDVIELTHRHTEKLLGTIKVGLGKLQTSWIWEH